MMKQITLLVIISSMIQVHGQNKVHVLTKMDECYAQLDSTVSEKHKQQLKITSDTLLIRWYRDSTTNYPYCDCLRKFHVFRGWNYRLSSPLVKEFKKQGLDNCQFKLLVLLMYKNYLNNDIANSDMKIKNSIQLIQQDITQRDQKLEKIYAKTKAHFDSILPHNLRETFIYLDSALSDTFKKNFIAHRSIKKRLRNRKKAFQYMANEQLIGQTIRNKLNLWGYSPLTAYFIKIEGHPTHPDDISNTIIAFYSQWLNGKHECWQAWEKETDAQKRMRLLGGCQTTVKKFKK